MAISKDRNYRTFDFRSSDEEGKMIIEGYAVTFDKPTTMYEYEGIEYKEQICRDAFKTTMMDDVVLNIDHEGKPLARTKNGTLELSIDETGVKVRADLSGTDAGRKAYEEIKGGYFDKMSFCFITDENGETYDRDNHLRSITGIKRLFDVSVVTFPAYDTTSVFARSYFEAEAEKERLEKRMIEEERRKRLLKRKKLALKIKIESLGGF